MNTYRVTYRVKGTASSTNATTTIALHSSSVNEAINALIARGTVSENRRDMITIISIEKI